MPGVKIEDKIAFGPRPGPNFLHQSAKAKAILVCLDVEQQIPPHAEENQAFFYVVQGRGVITAGDEQIPVSAGWFVEVPFGGVRGIRAEERMVVLATAVL